MVRFKERIARFKHSLSGRWARFFGLLSIGGVVWSAIDHASRIDFVITRAPAVKELVIASLALVASIGEWLTPGMMQTALIVGGLIGLFIVASRGPKTAPTIALAPVPPFATKGQIASAEVLLGHALRYGAALKNSGDWDLVNQWIDKTKLFIAEAFGEQEAERFTKDDQRTQFITAPDYVRLRTDAIHNLGQRLNYVAVLPTFDHKRWAKIWLPND